MGTANAQPARPSNVAVTPAVKDAYQQPSLAQDPSRPGRLAIAFQSGHSLATCFVARSGNRGASWSTQALVGAGGSLPLPPGAFCWNPSLTFGPDGTLYYVFQTGFYFHNGDRRVLLAVSHDGGATFARPVAVAPLPEENQFWPGLAVDQRSGQVYVSFTRTVVTANGAGPVVVASSDDRGTTFSPALPVNPAHALALGSTLAVGTDGRVYLGYLDQRTNPLGSDPDLIVGASADGARTFTTTSMGPSAGGCLGMGDGFDRLHADGPCRLISIATGRRGGEAYATWWDERGPANLARVVITSTRDGGTTWSAPRVIGIPPGRAGDHQHRPWPAVTADGLLHVVFYDRQGKNQDGPQRVFETSSADGGVTFGAARLVSDAPSDSRIGPTGTAPGGYPGLADFLAAVPMGNRLGMAWTDMRRGDQASGKQDIYFAGSGR